MSERKPRARRRRASKPLPAHLDPRLPPKSIKLTTALLARSALLKKIDRNTPADELEVSRLAAEKLKKAWEQHFRRARARLGGGRLCGVSFHAWRGAIWKDPRYRHYQCVEGRHRQQTPEYKAWKKEYDKRRKRLIKSGLWDAHRAHKALDSARERFVDGVAHLAHGDDYAQLWETMEAAQRKARRFGPYCDECESRSCGCGSRLRLSMRFLLDAITQGEERQAELASARELALVRAERRAQLADDPLGLDHDERQRTEYEDAMKRYRNELDETDRKARIERKEAAQRVAADLARGREPNRPLTRVEQINRMYDPLYKKRVAPQEEERDEEEGPPKEREGRFIDGAPHYWSKGRWVPDQPILIERPAFAGDSETPGGDPQ